MSTVNIPIESLENQIKKFDELKKKNALTNIAEHPKVIKKPVIMLNNEINFEWKNPN